MHIKIGDIFWLKTKGDTNHPHVVIDLLKNKADGTVMVCALTTNNNKSHLPGNVIINSGEANLPLQSIVEVSKLQLIKRQDLNDYIGSLNSERISQIQEGINFLNNTYFQKPT